MAAEADDAFALLCAAIGPEATARLQAAAAGSWVYVPEQARPGTRLAVMIGPAAVAAAIEAIGCGEVYVRKPPASMGRVAALRRLRDAEIHRLRAAGRPLGEIAAACGVAVSTVKAVLAGPEPQRPAGTGHNPA